jgi:hypothetical protein
MTRHLFDVVCIAFMQFVLGPAVLVWVTAKVNAKPKRKPHKKTTR